MVLKVYVTLEEELKKNPKLKTADVNELREWLKKQPHLPEMMDPELVLFLHRNSYRIEPTKVNIERYYMFKTYIPELFSDRDPLENENLRKAFNVISFTPMKKTTKEGYKVIVCRLIDPDASKFNLNDCLKYLGMIFDELLYHEGTMEGYVLLTDTAPVTLGHVGQMRPMTMKKILTYVQEALPLSLRGLHFVNTNSTADVILNIIKPFMMKELAEMVHLHPNVDSLKKYVPLEIIPNELGGAAGPLMDLHKAQIKKLEDLRDWFLDEETRARVDDSKRTKKRKASLEISDHDIFDGSFRKLNTD